MWDRARDALRREVRAEAGYPPTPETLRVDSPTVKTTRRGGPAAGPSATGLMLGIDPAVDLDNHPRRMQTILEELQSDEDLDNQEKELLKIYVGKLKAQVTAQQSGVKP